MKNCARCHEDKEETDFGKDKFRKDGHCIYCKPCRTIIGRLAEQKPSCKIVRLERKVRARRFILEYYKLNPCSCGETRAPCLQANHIDPSKKEYNIANMVGKGLSIELIKKELDKCEIMCANCHMMHTAEQFGWYKNLEE